MTKSGNNQPFEYKGEVGKESKNQEAQDNNSAMR